MFAHWMTVVFIYHLQKTRNVLCAIASRMKCWTGTAAALYSIIVTFPIYGSFRSSFGSSTSQRRSHIPAAQRLHQYVWNSSLTHGDRTENRVPTLTSDTENTRNAVGFAVRNFWTNYTTGRSSHHENSIPPPPTSQRCTNEALPAGNSQPPLVGRDGSEATVLDKVSNTRPDVAAWTILTHCTSILPGLHAIAER